jgi:homoserine O-acetyltransferase
MVLQQLGITDTIHGVVGASMGGMQALQFASLYPSSVSRLVAIACTGKTTPFTVGIRRMQRRAILSDPHYYKGNYADHAPLGPWEGIRLAREIGTLFYRSREEMDSRFDWNPRGDNHFTSLDTWEIENYLSYQGAKFSRAYDPNAYLLLSKSMDLMDLGDGVEGRKTYAEGAARISANSLLVGVKQDALIPAAELACLAETINAGKARHNAKFHLMDSVYGHDAFLIEYAELEKLVRHHLEDGLQADLQAESLINTGGNAP